MKLKSLTEHLVLLESTFFFFYEKMEFSLLNHSWYLESSEALMNSKHLTALSNEALIILKFLVF